MPKENEERIAQSIEAFKKLFKAHLMRDWHMTEQQADKDVQEELYQAEYRIREGYEKETILNRIVASIDKKFPNSGQACVGLLNAEEFSLHVLEQLENKIQRKLLRKNPTLASIQHVFTNLAEVAAKLKDEYSPSKRLRSGP